LDAEARLAGLVQGTTRVEEATLRASGDLERLVAEVEAQGSLPDPFVISGAGSFRQEGTTQRATLDRLTGEIAEVPMRLVRPATVRLEAGTVELDGLELEVDTARLDIRGSLGPERVDGRARLDGLDLERLAAFGVPAVVGRLDAAVDLAGTRTAPRIDGSLDVGGLALGDGAGDVDMEIAAGFALADGRLGLVTTASGLGETPVRLDANLPIGLSLEPFVLDVPDPLPLDARLLATIDLARLGQWLALDGQRLAGRLDAEVTVDGTTRTPELEGQLAMADGLVEDLTVGALLTDLTVDVAATTDRLVIRRVDAGDGLGGTASLVGDVVFGGDEVALLDLALDLERFHAPQSEMLLVETSGRTTVQGTPRALDVFGRLTVNSGEIRIPENGAQSFPTLNPVEASALEEDTGEPAPTQQPSVVDLDIVVDIPGRVFVRGRGLVSEWGGNITVTGDARSPRIVGGIGYRRGQLDLLGRRFAFREGEILFGGAFPPDPTVDIEMAVELSDVVALLAVSGPALDPTISVTSDPPLPEDEVLSRLIFDRGVERLNAVQAVRLAVAVDTLRGGGGGLLETTRNLFGLDTIDVAGDSLEDASLRAGVYVTDEIFLQLEQGLAPGSGSARVEIELTPRITLHSEVREDQSNSIGLGWSMDY
ncbi:MAG: translocation/assembly module TamB domain-containing protein, partial [Pseudomonadota bacterium]